MPAFERCDYMWEDNALRRFDLDYPKWSYPGAGLNTTISDLANWDAALYTEKLVKRSTLERMWTRTRLNSGETADYGLGWAVFDLEGHKAVGHAGGRNNWIVHFVDRKLTIIVRNFGGEEGIRFARFPQVRQGARVSEQASDAQRLNPL